jgi:hypothetical protein
MLLVTKLNYLLISADLLTYIAQYRDAGTFLTRFMAGLFLLNPISRSITSNQVAL